MEEPRRALWQIFKENPSAMHLWHTAAGQAWGLWRTFVCVWVAYIVGRVCLCDMQWH